MQSSPFARLAAGLIALTALAVFAGLNAAPGRAATDAIRTRTLAPFDRVETDGAFTVRVLAGHAQRVTVSGDPAIVDQVVTSVEHGTLVITMRPGFNDVFHRQPHLTIELPALRAFGNHGAGSVTIDGVAGGALELSNAGAARMRVAGHVATLAIALDGVGLIDTTALDAQNVTVDNNGVGRVDVRASGNLTMNVNGVGEIRYAGKPATVDRHVNGIGRIERL
jgi:hypothetical protein